MDDSDQKLTRTLRIDDSTWLTVSKVDETKVRLQIVASKHTIIRLVDNGDELTGPQPVTVTTSEFT